MKRKPKDSKRVSAKKPARKNVDEPTGVLAGPKSKQALAKILAEIEANIETNNEDDEEAEGERWKKGSK
ncbi:MAG: hypothetical protein QM790_01620 [Nibricoccus sp.]